MGKPRGMPDVSLRPDTEEFIKEQEDKAQGNSDKVDNQAIFDKPHEMGKGVAQPDKPINRPKLKVIEEVDEGIADTDTVEKGNVEIVVKEKVKRKLTEKQLNALKMGREKSIAIRKAKAEEKKKLKEEHSAPKNHVETAQFTPTPTTAPYERQKHSNHNIDYDKIINGVADLYDNRRAHEKKVNNDVKDFERKVRAEERERVLIELEKIQEEETKSRNVKKAESILTRNDNVNPYSYAFDMGSRQRYKRY